VLKRGTDTSLRTQAAQGVFWTAMGNWGNQLAAFLVFVVLSRLLPPDAFGLVALAAVFVGLTQVIANQGLVDALVQRKNLDAEHLDTAFWMSMGFAVVLTLLAVAIALPIADLLHEPRLGPVLIGLALSIPISGLTLVQRALLARSFAFRSLTLRTLIAIVVGSVVGIGAALAGFGVWSLVAQNLANQLAGALVLWRVAAWRPRLRFSRSHFRDLFGYGFHVVNFRLLNYFNRRADDLLIGAFLGATALGFYSVAYRMLVLLIEVTSNLIDAVAFPVYSRLQDDGQRLRRVYYKSSAFAALIAFPGFLAILVLAPQLVEVVFGEKWSKSVPVMQVLTLFGIVQALIYLNSTMVKALGKPSWRVIIVGITAVFNVAAFFVAVRHGIVAVAVALVAVGFVLAPASFWAMNRLLPISMRAYAAHIARPLVASLVMAAVMLGLRQALDDEGPALVLITAAAAGGVAYIGTLFVIARPLADEAVELARRAIPRRTRPVAPQRPLASGDGA
jgi:PST family polysaccharide transporter